MKVSLNSKHLKAATCCAATQDVRYYLNGVLAEVRASEVRLVATNGSIAAVLRTVNHTDANPVFPDVIIPAETIKQALITKNESLTLEFNPDGKAWSLGGVSFKPVDGPFPAYRRIIPCAASGEAAHFDTDLIVAFMKAGKAIGHKGNPIIRHNGGGNAQVSFYGREEEFVGVIMPFRMFSEKHPDPGLIQWGHLQAK